MQLRKMAIWCIAWTVISAWPMQARAGDEVASVQALAVQIEKLAGKTPLDKRPLSEMLSRQIHARLHEANQREASAFEKVKTRADWDRFREARITALRESLGSFTPAPRDATIRSTGTIAGDGYRIDKLVFESRPGLLVTANLYRPDRPAQPPWSMPGIVVVHSFFHPKNQPESGHGGQLGEAGMPGAGAGPVGPRRAPTAYALCNQWDTTRRLRNSARDGFVPWVIVGSVAPRRLIYAHEFAWDRERDPVWPRLQKIYDLCDARDRLAFAHGYGLLSSKPEESSGCGNIGAALRKPLYEIFQRWHGMPPPEKEVQQRRSAEELICLTPEVAAAWKPRRAHEIAADLARERQMAAHRRLAELNPEARRSELRRAWSGLLGDVTPPANPKASDHARETLGEITVERMVLEVDSQVVVPVLLPVPPRKEKQRPPVVVALAQPGKEEFLRRRADTIAELLRGGVAVCLPDVSGIGATRPGGDQRGAPTGTRASVAARSEGTLLANGAWMLGGTLVGDRLRDLRSVVHYLRSRGDLDVSRLGYWGDSFAPVNAINRSVAVPWDAKELPGQAEPLGGLLALLGALFEDDARAVAVRGGLVGFASLLESPFFYVPHDAVVPGAVAAGDLVEVVGALAPRPLRLEGLVDGRNQRVAADALPKILESALQAYRAAGKRDQLSAMSEPTGDLGRWLLLALR